MGSVRLNKYLASLGVASRRKIDDLTTAGRITINGRPAVLGDKVDPRTDRIIVDKKIIAFSPPYLVYYALNKPKYVLSSVSDDRGRETVLKYVPALPKVFPVGRLDFESTGLILLTNDGEFSQKVIHPRYHLPKVYRIIVNGKITPEVVSSFKKGVRLEEGLSAPAGVKLLPSNYGHPVLEITLYEGKKRQIRRMCAVLHLHVVDLQRISIGPITLENLAPGEYRELSNDEVKLLTRS